MSLDLERWRGPRHVLLLDFVLLVLGKQTAATTETAAFKFLDNSSSVASFSSAEAVLGRRLGGYDTRPPAAWGDQGFCARAPASAPVARATNDRPEKWVEVHNHYRACHGLPGVTWSPVLAGYAKAWAEELVQHCANVADTLSWAQAGTPQEQRPHDPNQYQALPRSGENINTISGYSPTMTESTHCEAWYREVETRCPNRGLTPGCGGQLNHYTAMVWTTVAYIGCYTAVSGDFTVADCRYASSAPDGGSFCEPPNTFIVPDMKSCSEGDAWNQPHVPALTGGQQCLQFTSSAVVPTSAPAAIPASPMTRTLSLQQSPVVEKVSRNSWFCAWIGMGVVLSGLIVAAKRWRIGGALDATAVSLSSDLPLFLPEPYIGDGLQLE